MSRYLDDIDTAPDAALPTGNNVGDGIADGTIDAEKAVPEGAALLDGCETPAQRPSEPKARKAAYSGKKKRHTRNTLFAATLAGIITCMSRPRPGRARDMRILKREKNRTSRLLRAMLPIGKASCIPLEASFFEADIVFVQEKQNPLCTSLNRLIVGTIP